MTSQGPPVPAAYLAASADRSPPHRPGALVAPELSLPGNGVGSRCPQLFRSFKLNVGGAGGARMCDLGACRPFGTWGY